MERGKGLLIYPAIKHTVKHSGFKYGFSRGKDKYIKETKQCSERDRYEFSAW